MSGVRLTAFRVSLLSTLSIVLLYVWASQFILLRNLDANHRDLRFHLRGMQQPEAPVILVVIDDRSRVAFVVPVPDGASAALSPDGRRLFTASTRERSVRVYDVDTGWLVRS